MNKMLLEEIDLRFAIWIGRCQEPLRAWSGAGRYRQAAAIAVRAKAPRGFAEGQDGTLSV
jgi:hypothetical protein